MEKAIVFYYSDKKDRERAEDLFNAGSETEAIGRARMQASLIKDAAKIIGRFEAMFHRFGPGSQITQIFANRLLVIWKGSSYEQALLEGAQDRIRSSVYQDSNEEKFVKVTRLLYRLGFVMMSKKLEEGPL
jgi:hypothetical protein